MPRGVGIVGAAVLVGAVGALLATPAHRLSVPWGEPPADRCRRCEAPFPAGLPGWLRLGTRCRACGARNGPPTWSLAGATAVAAAGLTWRLWLDPSLALFLALVPLACLLCAVDLACHRLPERLVLPAIAAALLGFAVLSAVTGEWSRWWRSVLAGLALGTGYLLLTLISAGQLGGGDVTLAALLGVFLGWIGWRTAVLGAALPFAINAPVALALLVARRVGRRSELPFGPAMVIGWYVAVVGPAVVSAALAP